MRRSRGGGIAWSGLRETSRGTPGESPTGPAPTSCSAHAPRRSARSAARRGGVVRRKRQDRKSTRLNSSHLVISYAVFCLKKKKIDCSPFKFSMVHLGAHSVILIPITLCNFTYLTL